MSEVFGSALWSPPNRVVDSQCSHLFECLPDYRYAESVEELYGFFNSPNLDKKMMIHNVIRFIKKSVLEEKPFSIIRLGDGEGCIFFREIFECFGSELSLYVEKRISQIIFGAENVVPDNISRINYGLSEAIKGADVIGVPLYDFIDRRLYREQKSNVDIRAVCGSLAQVVWLRKNIDRLSAKMVVSPWISRDLLHHYKEILSLFENVAIITGSPGLAEKISSSLNGGREVSEVIIPTQRALKANFHPRNIHYPDRFESVLDDLGELPKGTLVLVAAGIIGKLYCNEAKKLSLSSIDIGSVADLWMGGESRPGFDVAKSSKWVL